MYTLYTIPGSCSTGITVLLEKLGQPVNLVTRAEVPNYQDFVPTNQVPALKDGDLLITEGAAIALYLLEKHPNDMLPKDLAAKAEFLQWLMFNYATLHPAYAKVMAVKKTMEDGPLKPVLLQQLADKVSDSWAIVNARLANRRYMAGDAPSVVDYLVAIYTSWAGKFFPEVRITTGEHVERLAQEISALPEFVAAYAAENVEFKAAA